MKLAHSFLLCTFIAYAIVEAKKCGEPLGPSLPPPTSVHKLRPADIGIIGAMGDSDSAAYVTRGDFYTEDKDLSFITGANNEHSLASILHQYNTGLEGMSLKPRGKPGLNVAVSGAASRWSTAQAKKLIKKIKKMEDWKEKWKIVSIQNGGNDICTDSCDGKIDATPAAFGSNLEAAVDLLKAKLPRTMVLLLVPFDVTPLMDMTNKSRTCEWMHDFGCSCMFGPKNQAKARRTVAKLTEDYGTQIEMLAQKDKYNSEDFTVEVIPSYKGVYPKVEKDGKLVPDKELMAVDCFHFSPALHSAIGVGIWNNLVEPADQRTVFKVGDNIKCLTRERPFLSTKKNSAP